MHPPSGRLTSEFFTSSSPEGWRLYLPWAPDTLTGWPSFSQWMSGSGLPLATQGRRAWEPSVADRSGRLLSITGGTAGIVGQSDSHRLAYSVSGYCYQ